MTESMQGQSSTSDNRHNHSPLRRFLVWGLPAAFTLGWILYVILGGHLDRVADNWRAALTMLFGSFVAGSTPQGGGAVAFPVFTKVLAVPAPVARSFSLTIQATGMVMAAASILLAGRKVDWKALGLGVLSGSVGLLVGLFALGDPSTTFWNPRIDSAYVKVSFTLIIFAVALIVRLSASQQTKYDEVPYWGKRSVSVMLVFGFVGGIFSSLTGSGADVMLFVFIVLVAQVSPRVAIPTSIIAMAFVSVVGYVILGLWHGQLNIGIEGDQVVSVAGKAFGPESATRFDLFGIWLAAAPIVVWGAPFGAWLAAQVSERTIIRFVATMALLEVLTTAIFLDQLHSDIVLASYAIIGLFFMWWAVNRLGHLSSWIMVDHKPDEKNPSGA